MSTNYNYIICNNAFTLFLFVFQLHGDNFKMLFLRTQGIVINAKYTKDGLKIPQRTSNGPIQTDESGQAFVEWRILAVALDRIFFVVYVIVITLTVIFIFPR